MHLTRDQIAGMARGVPAAQPEPPLSAMIRAAACLADEGRFLASIDLTGAPPALLRPIITGGPFATTAQSAGRVGNKK